jgi:hypothetical protein
MKRWELLAGSLVLLVALLIVPRQVWLHGKRERFKELSAQVPDCRTIPCLDKLTADFHALNEEIDHRPWYVWGDVDLK